MKIKILKTLITASAVLVLTACGTIAQISNYEPPRPSGIVSGPEFTGKQSPFGPLKRETAELRERLKDPKNYYRYQYSELWIAGAFPIERGVVVFAAPGRPLRSGDEIAAAAQCHAEDIRKSVSSGESVALADKKLLLAGTNGREMNAWHAQFFGKNEQVLGRTCRINTLFDM
jgi:hypothetical protein